MIIHFNCPIIEYERIEGLSHIVQRCQWCPIEHSPHIYLLLQLCINPIINAKCSPTEVCNAGNVDFEEKHHCDNQVLI